MTQTKLPAAAPAIYGVVGSPIGHSLSPLLHNAAFRHYGVNAAFTAWAIAPDDFAAFVSALRLLGIAGVSVTIPHKEAALELADRVEKRAEKVGAANTLTLRDNVLHADNTDVEGFMAPLLELWRQPPAAGRDREDAAGAVVPATATASSAARTATPARTGQKALILGAGGAARAAAVGLLELGITDIAIAGRTPENARRLAEAFRLRVVPWNERGDIPATLIVNTTPLGMAGKTPNESPYPAECLRGRSGIVYDTVYIPYATRLLQDAAAAGWHTLSGLAMFLAQGARQFQAWTGKPLPESAAETVTTALYGTTTPPVA